MRRSGKIKKIQQNPKELEEKIKQFDKALEDAKKKLQGSREELEAHEGLLRLAFEDMRHFYDDLQKSQAQLVQADKLAAIGLLSAGISHEIKNPLGAVLVVFALLKTKNDDLRQCCQNLPSKEKEKALEILNQSEKFVRQGQECADRMAVIVKDIKMFSRSDKGKMSAENIHDVIDSVIGIVWNAVKHRIKLKKEYGDIPPVKCNAQQLGQVFMNLLVNASQAMNGSGAITIRTHSEDKHITVEIADTGPGIPEEVKARIFEPFFTTKGPETGTGLGLSISRDIILKHEGSIQVESLIGQGTTFTVRLPRGD